MTVRIESENLNLESPVKLKLFKMCISQHLVRYVGDPSIALRNSIRHRVRPENSIPITDIHEIFQSHPEVENMRIVSIVTTIVIFMNFKFLI